MFDSLLRMSSYFPTSCVVCVLTVAAGQQRCYRGSWGAPRPPCWERLGPGQRLWSCFQMFPLMGEKHVGRRSLKRILPNTAGAKTQSGPDSRRAGRVLLAGERLVLWMWFGRGSVSMNYWRISNDGDGQAFVSAPAPPGCGHTADALVRLVWFLWLWSWYRSDIIISAAGGAAIDFCHSDSNTSPEITWTLTVLQSALCAAATVCVSNRKMFSVILS